MPTTDALTILVPVVVWVFARIAVSAIGSERHCERVLNRVLG